MVNEVIIVGVEGPPPWAEDSVLINIDTNIIKLTNMIAAKIGGKGVAAQKERRAIESALKTRGLEHKSIQNIVSSLIESDTAVNAFMKTMQKGETAVDAFMKSNLGFVERMGVGINNFAKDAGATTKVMQNFKQALTVNILTVERLSRLYNNTIAIWEQLKDRQTRWATVTTLLSQTFSSATGLIFNLNTALKDAYATGLVFEKGLFEMSTNAGLAGLSLVQYSQALQDYSEVVKALGDDGEKALSEFLFGVRNLAIKNSLYGMSIEELNSFSLDYLETLRQQDILDSFTATQRKIRTNEYLKELTEATTILGKSRQQIHREVTAAAKSPLLTATFAAMDEKTAKMATATNAAILTRLSAFGGSQAETLIDAWNATWSANPLENPNFMALTRFAGDLSGTFQDLRKAIENGSISTEQASKVVEQTIMKNLVNMTAGQLKTLKVATKLTTEFGDMGRSIQLLKNETIGARKAMKDRALPELSVELIKLTNLFGESGNRLKGFLSLLGLETEQGLVGFFKDLNKEIPEMMNEVRLFFKSNLSPLSKDIVENLKKFRAGIRSTVTGMSDAVARFLKNLMSPKGRKEIWADIKTTTEQYFNKAIDLLVDVTFIFFNKLLERVLNFVGKGLARTGGRLAAIATGHEMKTGELAGDIFFKRWEQRWDKFFDKKSSNSNAMANLTRQSNKPKSSNEVTREKATQKAASTLGVGNFIKKLNFDEIDKSLKKFRVGLSQTVMSISDTMAIFFKKLLDPKGRKEIWADIKTFFIDSSIIVVKATADFIKVVKLAKELLDWLNPVKNLVNLGTALAFKFDEMVNGPIGPTSFKKKNETASLSNKLEQMKADQLSNNLITPPNKPKSSNEVTREKATQKAASTLASTYQERSTKLEPDNTLQMSYIKKNNELQMTVIDELKKTRQTMVTESKLSDLLRNISTSIKRQDNVLGG